MTEFSGAGDGNDAGVTGDVRAESLLRRPVRLRGLKIGTPVDLLLDLETMRAVGLEIACGDDARRFLPLAAARVHEREIEISSALLLLEEDGLAFYRRRGRTLRALRGRRASLAGREAGILRDVVVDAAGTVTYLELEGPDGRPPLRLQVPAGARVTVDDAPASAA